MNVFPVQAATVASITLRATMGRKRALLFALPPVILLLVTVALKAAHPADASWPSAVLGEFGLAVVLPLLTGCASQEPAGTPIPPAAHGY